MEVIDQKVPALVHMPHPLTSDGRAVFYAAFLEDETVGEYFRRQGVELPHGSVSLWCNDIPVPSTSWELLIPYPGDKIVIRTALEGGGGGGIGKVLRTVAMVAIAVAAPQLGAMAVSSFGGIGLAAAIGSNGILIANGIAAAAIIIGGSMLVNALLPPPRASINSSYQSNSQTPTYALSGGRNSARLYEPMLLCVGYNKVIPDMASNAYTEFVGQEQYLYQAFHFGLSDVTLSDFKIGDTPIENFTDVTVEVSGPDGQLSLIAGNVDSVSVQDLGSDVGWVQRTTSVDTASIAVDIVATLYYVSDSGPLESRSVTFEMEYRATGTSAWVAFAAGAVTLSGASQTPVRNTYSMGVPRGQYDVRVRKSTQDVSSSRESNALSWSQMRSYQADTGNYAGQTRVGIRIRASAQLNGTIDTFSAMAQARCPVWTGTEWVVKATSNPAWWCLWWARGKFINGRRVYGACLPDSRIDVAGLKEFGAYCDANGLTVNFVQGAGLSIGAMMDQIALCGDGSATWLTGKLGVVWDAPNQPAVMQFGPFNIKRDSFQIEYNTQNLADEIIVDFINPDKGWTTDQVRARAPNVTAPTNPVTLDFVGCASAGLAGRKANLMAAGQYYHRRKVTWISDLEGFVAQRGDVVVLSHDMTAWSYAGRLMGGDRDTLRLDRAVPLSASPGYIGIRFPDGTYQVFGVEGGTGTSDQLRLTQRLPETVEINGQAVPLPVPDENPDMLPFDWAFVFDPLSTPGKLVKITAVIPQNGGDEVQIVATDEEPAYYAAASGVYDYVPPRQYGHLGADVISIAASERLLNGATGQTRVTVSWVTGIPTNAEVSVRANGGPAQVYTAEASSLEVDAYTNDVLDVTVQPRSFVQMKTGAPRSLRHVVAGILAPLPQPEGLAAVYRDQLTHVVWRPVQDVRVPVYEVRTGEDWQSGVVVAVTPLPDVLAVGNGRYWVAARWQSPSGSLLYSVPTDIILVGAVLVRNVLIRRDEAPSWSGAKSGGVVRRGQSILLGPGGNILAVPDVLSMQDFIWFGDLQQSGAYEVQSEHVVDVGRVAPCQVLLERLVHGQRLDESALGVTDFLAWPDVLGEALGTVVSARPQISIAQQDGVFSAWADFSPGVFNGRWFKARLLLATQDRRVTPVVDHFVVTVDMPDRIDTYTNVQVLAAGLTVTFGSPFNGGPDGANQPHVQVTLLQAQPGDVIVVDNVTLLGCSVRVTNNGLSVTRNINLSAQGY